MMTGVRRKDVMINIYMNSFNYTTPFSDVRDCAYSFVPYCAQEQGYVTHKSEQRLCSILSSYMQSVLCSNNTYGSISLGVEET